MKFPNGAWATKGEYVPGQFVIPVQTGIQVRLWITFENCLIPAFAGMTEETITDPRKSSIAPLLAEGFPQANSRCKPAPAESPGH